MNRVVFQLVLIHIQYESYTGQFCQFLAGLVKFMPDTVGAICQKSKVSRNNSLNGPSFFKQQ